MHFYKLQILNFKQHLSLRTKDSNTFDYCIYLKRAEKVSSENLIQGQKNKGLCLWSKRSNILIQPSSFNRNMYYIKLYMCVCVWHVFVICLWHTNVSMYTWMQVPNYATSIGSPGTGVTGSYELSSVGSMNSAQVLPFLKHPPIPTPTQTPD